MLSLARFHFRSSLSFHPIPPLGTDLKGGTGLLFQPMEEGGRTKYFYIHQHQKPSAKDVPDSKNWSYFTSKSKSDCKIKGKELKVLKREIRRKTKNPSQNEKGFIDHST